MCSRERSSTSSNIHKCRYTEEINSTYDWEDSDESVSDFKFGRVRRGTSMPEELRQIVNDAAKMKRKSKSLPRSRECSMQKETKDWHRSSVVNREGELNAERYCKMVTDDTWEHLRHTIRTADSIVDKGNAINDELARQGRVLSTADHDIAMAEYDTDLTTQKLKGMKSLKGKVASMVRKKEPKLRIDEFSKETSSFSNVNLNLLEDDVGLCSFSKLSSSKTSSICKDISKTTEDIQVQMKAGIGQLHKTLDAISVQQMDTALALDQQNGRLSVFENRLTTTHQKINCQTQVIKSIMGK